MPCSVTHTPDCSTSTCFDSVAAAEVSYLCVWIEHEGTERAFHQGRSHRMALRAQGLVRARRPRRHATGCVMRRIRYWVIWSALIAALASVAVWLATRETLPSRIRIATARSGGLYFELGRKLASSLEERTGRAIDVVESDGSRENLDLLSAGKVDLAILQLGPHAPEAGVVAMAPLYDDLVHVVVRAGAGIEDIHGLEGRKILVGAPNSGMRITADVLLDHYDVDHAPFDDDLRHFTALLEDPSLDGAIVTAGIANKDLERILGSGEFALLPIDQADAIGARHPMMSPRTLPRGIYRGVPPVPREATPTLGTPAILCVAADASDVLVVEVLEALYASRFQREFPGLTTREAAASFSLYPRHEAAIAYYDPYQGLGVLANLFEALAAIKELLFALGAVSYVVLSWWRSLERREEQAELSLEKEHLDQLIEATAQIEREQLHEHDVQALERHRDAIVLVKHRALAELTREEVRGDRMFSILLLQAEAVSRAIEAKLARAPLVPAPRRGKDA